MKKNIKVHITTFGCQMNVYDTEVAEGLLEHQGYEILKEASFEQTSNRSAKRDLTQGADIVVMNTCSVREHAEDRVFGRLGSLGKIKKERPELVIGLMGCMVEEHRERLFKRFPYLDFMVGTRNLKDLPGIIDRVQETREQVAHIKRDGISIEYTELIKRQSKFHAWLPVMTGCNKVCTYCIVPITRGSEVSMKARHVYREASRLAAEGVKCITLLGQNVNSYRGEEEGEPSVLFPELLERLCQIDDIKCISFTTSHPQDATEDLFQVISQNKKISRRFHLPLQSGSNKMLKRMKRLHRYEDFAQKVSRLRELVDDIAITTDIIAGFSGEGEEDHQETVRAMKELKFDSAYIYKYSTRPGTPAAKLPDDVPLPVKERRNQELLELRRDITRLQNQKWLGREVPVFVEGINPRVLAQLIGRTMQDKKVGFAGPRTLIGQSCHVKLQDLRNETFLGNLIL
jgi:tRNA-2-methylthio-N6-dimethylallyladenosine synthase